MAESPQTEMYKAILKDCMTIRIIIQVVKNDGNVDILPPEAKGLYSYTFGQHPLEKLNIAWESLQMNVNNIVDTSQAQKKIQGQGLKQASCKKFARKPLLT